MLAKANESFDRSVPLPRIVAFAIVIGGMTGDFESQRDRLELCVRESVPCVRILPQPFKSIDPA